MSNSLNYELFESRNSTLYSFLVSLILNLVYLYELAHLYNLYYKEFNKYTFN